MLFADVVLCPDFFN